MQPVHGLPDPRIPQPSYPRLMLDLALTFPDQWVQVTDDIHAQSAYSLRDRYRVHVKMKGMHPKTRRGRMLAFWSLGDSTFSGVQLKHFRAAWLSRITDIVTKGYEETALDAEARRLFSAAQSASGSLAAHERTLTELVKRTTTTTPTTTTKTKTKDATTDADAGATATEDDLVLATRAAGKPLALAVENAESELTEFLKHVQAHPNSLNPANFNDLI